MSGEAPRVLMVFAHADDETLLAGALIAKLVSTGHEVNLLCLAPGDNDRIRRMRNACEDLGVSTVETFSYTDGTVRPDEVSPQDDENPGRTLSTRLVTAPIEDLAGRISGRMSESAPDLVITHSRYGDYGHADHAVTHQATRHAFESWGNNRARLYALDWPGWLVWLNIRFMKIGRGDVGRMGLAGRVNLRLAIREKSGTPASIPVGDMLKIRRRASRWYQSEISRGPLPLRLLERLPLWIQKWFLGTARLTLLRAPRGFSPGGSIEAKTSTGDSSSGEYL
ncbi:MAG: PIG-L family deacetylase [Chloroflexi bacterium]|nr:PIG-L family deacetylase [Chloroflexota bacterium]